VLQHEAYEHFKLELEAYEVDLQRWQDATKKERGEKPERPTLEHYFTTDATMEAAAKMLSESPGVALYQDELVGWVKACDAYRSGRGGDRQRWLSQWAGEPLKVDRRGADPIYVAHPCMPVFGGVQPELLPELADEAGRRDGFIERLLWSAAPAPPAEWSAVEVSEADKAAMVIIFRTMRQSAADRPVKLSPEARTAWIAWYNENARLTAETTGIAQGIYAKLPNQAARLALILHSLRHPQAPAATLIAASTMADAIMLAEYFRAHAQAILPYFQTATAPRSAGLAARVRRVLERAHGEWIKRTELHQKLGGRTPAEALSEALAALAAEGVAEGQQVDTGRRPSEQWRLRSIAGPVSDTHFSEEYEDMKKSNGTGAALAGAAKCSRGHPLLMYGDQRTGMCSRCAAEGLR
jgi:CRISPR-associated protein Cmr3